MEKIVSLAEGVADEIKSTPEYAEYVRLKGLIKPTAWAKIDEYRQQQMLFADTVLYGADCADNEPAFQLENRLNLLFRELELHDYAMEFVEAEKRVFEMTSCAMDVIAEALEVDW